MTAIHYTLKLYIIPQRTYIHKVLSKLEIYEIFHELVKTCFSFFLLFDCLFVCLLLLLLVFCFFYIKTSIFRVLELPICTCIYVQCSITEYITET